MLDANYWNTLNRCHEEFSRQADPIVNQMMRIRTLYLLPASISPQGIVYSWSNPDAEVAYQRLEELLRMMREACFKPIMAA